MIFDALGLALIYGLLTRGNFYGIADIVIKKPLFFILGFGAEFGMLYLSSRFPIIMVYKAYIHLFDYIMLFIGLWYNRDNKYIRFIGIGVILNFIVIFANGGRMPVSLSALRTAGLNNLIPDLVSNRVATHQILNSGTRFKFLADVMVLPKPYPLPKTFSIGDLFIASGIFAMIANAMSKSKMKDKFKSKNLLH
ncbi:hypothetical protein SAMN02746089_02736 [Caldanaerobius fijiensis DSM 17918]|uniref:DUF5317 domain-containing protein n=1 Tax=Caldanaerobius fijiensis DSM 17918 TaxID=1121256 RepID=A0A1M5FDF0_9THEO|nr:DUF5317 domain-containing protein [Caldanaerobius fijiensis]SHF89554.1 hypothetical protein SAMN02746089_02736 [Caldanaerobius fijiensis DSM 17918]